MAIVYQQFCDLSSLFLCNFDILCFKFLYKIPIDKKRNPTVGKSDSREVFNAEIQCANRP